MVLPRFSARSNLGRVPSLKPFKKLYQSAKLTYKPATELRN